MKQEQFIGCDAHKEYSVFVTLGPHGMDGQVKRVGHELESMRNFLSDLPSGTPIALEAGGTYYWLVQEMERAGHRPRLAHPLECRRRMGSKKKTDVKDATELARMLRDGSLPEVSIPSPELRDQRELLRMRMFLVHSCRTRLKNRIKGMLGQYNLRPPGIKDVFTGIGRQALDKRMAELPPITESSVEQQLTLLDFYQMQIEEAEQRLAAQMTITPEAQLLDTLPCVGPILSMVMALEIGDVSRFPDAEHLASYGGLVPKVHSSGGHTRLGGTSREVNRTLKWAYVEAANVIVTQQKRLAGTHAVRLYQRVKAKQNSQKAAVAVGRHLAEASYWMLIKKEAYREPKAGKVSSTHG
jgi:transposase